MGFLHLGWDIAAMEEVPGRVPRQGLSPEWAATAAEIDLQRPGLAAVRHVMGWSPLHMAAMEGKIGLVRRLVKEFGCSLLQRSANSWTPLHYAAAHNQVQRPCNLQQCNSIPDTYPSISRGCASACLQKLPLCSKPLYSSYKVSLAFWQAKS